MPYIVKCIHCGDGCTKDYCKKCSTLEKRLEVDENNRKNFEENGLKYQSPCKQCQKELDKKKKCKSK